MTEWANQFCSANPSNQNSSRVKLLKVKLLSSNYPLLFTTDKVYEHLNKYTFFYLFYVFRIDIVSTSYVR